VPGEGEGLGNDANQRKNLELLQPGACRSSGREKAHGPEGGEVKHRSGPLGGKVWYTEIHARGMEGGLKLGGTPPPQEQQRRDRGEVETE